MEARAMLWLFLPLIGLLELLQGRMRLLGVLCCQKRLIASSA
jgi:hypothetical protein